MIEDKINERDLNACVFESSSEGAQTIFLGGGGGGMGKWLYILSNVEVDHLYYLIFLIVK